MSSGIMSNGINKQLKDAALGHPKKCVPPPGSFLRTNEEVWCHKYRLAPDLIAFQGHFDGHPVLPALAQILMAKNTVSTILKREVALEAIQQAKFMSLASPGNVVSVYARPPQGDALGEWRFHLTIETSEKNFIDVSHLLLKMRSNIPTDSSSLAQESKLNHAR